ncbi:MAG: transposase [Mucilaginibacter sp.]|nr:transposase [Mucilaginibacter sp.]
MTKTIQEERTHYSREFKHSVIKEYLEGGIGKSALLKKYNIKINGGILRWMRQLGYIENEEKGRYLPPVKPLSLPSKKANKANPLSIESQDQRIKELERLLEDEQLRSEAYRRIIDIAEKEYNVPIRKKPNTR